MERKNDFFWNKFFIKKWWKILNIDDEDYYKGESFLIEVNIGMVL